MVNCFGKFLVSVGPDLAEQIPDPVMDKEQPAGLKDQSVNSMLWMRVILNTAAKCTNKTSTDWDENNDLWKDWLRGF